MNNGSGDCTHNDDKLFDITRETTLNHKKYSRKVLYATPSNCDNDCDSSDSPLFEGLHKDTLVVTYNYPQAVYYACIVSQHINCTMLYAATVIAYASTRRSEWLSFYGQNPQALSLEIALLATVSLCACARTGLIGSISPTNNQINRSPLSISHAKVLAGNKGISCERTLRTKNGFRKLQQPEMFGTSTDEPRDEGTFQKRSSNHDPPSIGGDKKKFRVKRGYKYLLIEFLQTFRVFAIFTAYNFALSPILASLTQSVSTDSIYVLATATFVFNAFFQDYQCHGTQDISEKFQTNPRYKRRHSSEEDNLEKSPCTSTSPTNPTRDRHAPPPNEPPARFSTHLGPPSFNSALFGSICLASRLPPSPYHAFTATSLGALVFGLWPDLRAVIRLYLPPHPGFALPWHALYTALLTGLTCTSLATLDTSPEPSGSGENSNVALLIFALTLNAIITLVIPYVFVRMQVYKNIIHGPWDEAVIRP